MGERVVRISHNEAIFLAGMVYDNINEYDDEQTRHQKLDMIHKLLGKPVRVKP